MYGCMGRVSYWPRTQNLGNSEFRLACATETIEQTRLVRTSVHPAFGLDTELECTKSSSALV